MNAQLAVLKSHTITYHRNKPTEWELKFGEGCTHYLDVDIEDAFNPKTGMFRKWIVGPDGLRYYR